MQDPKITRNSQPAPMPPDQILGMGFGFFAAKTLMTAVEVGLFSKLAEAPMLGKACEAHFNWHSRATYDFLDALVALKLLEKAPQDSDSLYRNSAAAALYLDKASEFYIGGILIMAGRRLYRFWNDLGVALTSGQPQSEVKHQEKRLFDEIFQDQSKLKEFCAAMTGLSRYNFMMFTDRYPFDRHKIHLDLGASMGLLSRFVVEKYPNIQSIAFDLPEVIPITRESLHHWKIPHDRVEVVGGSFFTSVLPRADVITLGNILHDWNLEDKKKILKNVFHALTPGGSMVIIENLIDDDRQENAFGLLMSLNMLIEFGDAYDTTFCDLENLCKDIGFAHFERMAVHGPCSALVAYKSTT